MALFSDLPDRKLTPVSTASLWYGLKVYIRQMYRNIPPQKTQKMLIGLGEGDEGVVCVPLRNKNLVQSWMILHIAPDDLGGEYGLVLPVVPRPPISLRKVGEVKEQNTARL